MTRTKPLRFRDESNMDAYVFVATEEEDNHGPLRYQEAVACEESSKRKAAMEEEMDSMRKNKTYELVDHLVGKKLVICKWLFKIKKGIEGVQKPTCKAKLVAHRFTQRESIDYNKVFYLVVRHTFIQVILALTTCKDYKLDMNKVCLLKKSLYGLKQSPRKCKANIGFTKSFLKKEVDMKELEEAKKSLDIQWEIGSNAIVEHFKLSLKDYPFRDCDVERTSKVPYANAVESYILDGVHEARQNVCGYTKDPDKGRVYGPYGGLKGSYLDKETLGRVGHRA
nr:retrovirus-related Pol polyprotein from transposon TNT 1-94 [Tanacetum cinerariifolium]